MGVQRVNGILRYHNGIFNLHILLFSSVCQILILSKNFKRHLSSLDHNWRWNKVENNLTSSNENFTDSNDILEVDLDLPVILFDKGVNYIDFKKY